MIFFLKPFTFDDSRLTSHWTVFLSILLTIQALLTWALSQHQVAQQPRFPATCKKRERKKSPSFKVDKMCPSLGLDAGNDITHQS